MLDRSLAENLRAPMATRHADVHHADVHYADVYVPSASPTRSAHSAQLADKTYP